jgi:hypothetical protein
VTQPECYQLSSSVNRLGRLGLHTLCSSFETLRPRDIAVSLEIKGGYDRGVIGLGIFSIDGEGGGLVVQDLVVNF